MQERVVPMTGAAEDDDDHRSRSGRLGELSRRRPVVALLIGAVFTGLTMTLGFALDGDTNRAVPALLLVVPVIGAAVVGGVIVSLVMAVLAAGAFALFLPPIGSFNVHAGEDVLALAVFAFVAVTTSRLVAATVAQEHQRAVDLQRIEVQRRAVLRSVSHDLRTPLTTIRAVASSLASAAPAGSRDADALDLVVDEAERMDRLIANLLNMSRIEARALHPVMEPVDLDHLISSCLSRLQRLTRDVRLRYDGTGDLPVVQGDPVQLEQVITNLVENAVRLSPPAGAVVITARLLSSVTGRDQVQVQVDDEGPGLPDGAASRLFVPFNTVSGNVVSGHGSSGIGLAICKAIIEQHHGTIDGENRRGGGASFRFTIPVRQP